MSAERDHKVRTLWLAGILHAFTHMYQMALIPLYLLIQKDLKLNGVEQATLLVTVMGLSYFLPSYPMGVLADRMSRKKLLAIGLAINGVGFACLGLSPNYACALVSVVVAGLGGSFYHPAATALVARLYPVGTGRALGLVAIGASIGFCVAPIYSGWRAEMTGNWRHPVVEMGVMGIIFSGVFYWLAQEEKGGVVLGMEKAKVRVTLFPTKALWGFFLVMAFALSLRDFAGAGMGTLGSLFLQKAHGMNPEITGFTLSGIYLASAISNPVFGHFSDKSRMRWGVALLVLAALMIAIFPRAQRAYMFGMLSAYGFFFMATYPVLEAALMEAIPDNVRGRVFGLFLTVGGLLGNISHWVVGAMVKGLGPQASVVSAYYPIYYFLASLVLIALIGVPCLHAIRRREGREDHAEVKTITMLNPGAPTE